MPRCPDIQDIITQIGVLVLCLVAMFMIHLHPENESYKYMALSAFSFLTGRAVRPVRQIRKRQAEPIEDRPGKSRMDNAG